MAGKKPPKKAPALPAGVKESTKARRQTAAEMTSLRFDFESGSVSIGIVEAELQLLKQYAAMAASDAPELRLIGELKLREVAEHAAANRLRVAHNPEKGRTSGKKRREFRDALRDRALKLYGEERAKGCSHREARRTVIQKAGRSASSFDRDLSWQAKQALEKA